MSFEKYIRKDWWPDDAENILYTTIPNARQCVRIGSSTNNEFTTTTKIDVFDQLVISYNPCYRIFIAWNSAIHAYLHKDEGKTIKFHVGSQINKFLKEKKFVDAYEIVACFRPISNYGVNCVEQILIIGRNAISDFCQEYVTYLYPDVLKIPEGKKCLYAEAGGKIREVSLKDAPLIRARESVDRSRRDRAFREKVLERWGKRCIVCGATEEQILEAAHIVSVKDGGSDDPENGYCLCANHHRMFDAKIMSVNMRLGFFSCTDEVDRDAPWYLSCERRNFKLYLPTEEQ